MTYSLFCDLWLIRYYLHKGILNVNVAPLLPSSLFPAEMVPPCASIILLEIYNPKPVPPVSDFVANFENNLDIISASIPKPVS